MDAPTRDGPLESLGEVVAPAKVMRLAAMADALVIELHASSLDAAARDHVWERYDALLIEVGSALSDPLLEELARLVSAGPGHSLGQLHVAVAQLAGWLHGLIAAMAAAQVPFLLAPAPDVDAA